MKPSKKADRKLQQRLNAWNQLTDLRKDPRYGGIDATKAFRMTGSRRRKQG